MLRSQPAGAASTLRVTPSQHQTNHVGDRKIKDVRTKSKWATEIYFLWQGLTFPIYGPYLGGMKDTRKLSRLELRISFDTKQKLSKAARAAKQSLSSWLVEAGELRASKPTSEGSRK